MKYWKMILVLTIILLAGCQQENNDQKKEDGVKSLQQTEVDQAGKYGVPYSNGPTAGPETMTGPTAPPPETPAAQAVTTKENIRLTLPRKVE